MAPGQVILFKRSFPSVSVENLLESDKEICEDPDISSLSPATVKRLTNRRILFGQASARNSQWYHDLVKETYDIRDAALKPLAVSLALQVGVCCLFSGNEGPSRLRPDLCEHS